MRIEILDELSAVRFAETTTERTAMISIVGKGSKPLAFPRNESVVSTLRMRFNDVDWGERHAGGPPSLKDFEGLSEFVDSLAETKPDVLAVHCGSGISRAPAVAQAVAERLGIEADFWNRRTCFPNLKVYELAKMELGDPISDDRARELYEMRGAVSAWNATTPKEWGFDEVDEVRRRWKKRAEKR